MNWRDWVALAGSQPGQVEEISGLFTEGRAWDVLIYGACDEAEIKLLEWKPIGMAFTFRPRAEAKMMGLAPGELRVAPLD